MVISKLIRKISDRHDLWSVWSDFVELSAIAISNTVDISRLRAPREERYTAITKRYEPAAVNRFAEALGALVVAFEDGIDDVLGRTFMDLELGSKWAGQFFTPFSICRMMSDLIAGDAPAIIEANGFVTASDPAVGAGAMPLALCAAMHDAGINYQRVLHVTAQDIDERAAHMCYVQLSIVHVPAIVIVGDTLRMEERARWYTPAHVIGGWTHRLRGAQPRLKVNVTDDEPTKEPHPAPTQPLQLKMF